MIVGHGTYTDVICTYKYLPDVRLGSETIRPFLEKNASFSPVVLPLIVLIQNGIDIEDEVYTAFVTSEKPLASGVVSGVTWVGVTLLGNGTRIEHGALERLKLGVYPAPLEESVPETTARPFERLVALFKKGESDVEATNDITAVRWSKLLWNVSWGGLAVVARQPLAAILDAEALPYTCGVVRGIMLELITIARAHGISEARLPSSLVDHTYEFTLKNSHADIRLSKDPARYFETQPGSSLPGDFKPSILVDLERQRPMELDPIFGHLLKRAREANVDTPRLDLIAAALKPSQLQFIRKAQEEEHNNVYVAYPAQNQTGGAPVL